MPQTDIGSAQASNLTNIVQKFEVPFLNTDAQAGVTETLWFIRNWQQNFGYYMSIPELKRAIDAKAMWTVGKGYEADSYTTAILDHIIGNGTDTFNSIVENMVITAQIVGDSFAEIIRDEKTGIIVNLKPLDPSTICIFIDSNGFIDKYQQISKVKRPPKNFRKDQIFHLVRNRVADQIHGIDVITPMIPLIINRNQTITDYALAMHYNVKPRLLFKIDTDNVDKIAAFAYKMDAACSLGENLYVPKDTVEYEVISVPGNATMDPMPWLNTLTNYFYQGVGIPQIIMGGSSDIAEANAKIAYLSFEQTVQKEQKDIEDQIWNQVHLKVKFNFPASLQNELISDQNKDSSQDVSFQPNDTMAGRGQ